MVLRDKKIIFFHIPKVAGYTIEQSLLPDDRDYRVFFPDLIFGLNKGIMTQHLTYSGMKEYIDESTMDSFFKFAFFRNTWERLVSAYTYLGEHHLKMYGDFDTFIKHVCTKVQNNDYKEGWHFCKQTDYLYKNKKAGELALNFVGRYENLDTEYKIICEKNNIAYTPLKKLNVTKSRNKPFKEYYSAETLELVRETYKDEINYFNYTI